ncbi:MAG: hypothetical protein AB7J28_07660 [Hyphomonadaceae bacterium]
MSEAPALSDAEAVKAQGLRGIAFDAFKKREPGGVILQATLGLILIVAVIVGLFGFIGWRSVVDYMQWVAQITAAQQQDPSAALAPGAMMPPASVMMAGNLLFVVQLVLYIVIAAYEAAILRWLTRGERGGVFLGLGFGADTWYVWFSYWIWYFLVFGVFLAVLFVGLIIGAVMAAAQMSAAVIAAAMGLLGLAIVVGCIYFAVRLAPAAATSVILRRFAFFDALKVTRDRFWPVFGAFLVIVLLSFVTAALAAGVGAVTLLAELIAGLANDSGQPDPAATMALVFSPAMIARWGVLYLVLLLLQLIWTIATYGLNARAAKLALAEGRIER